MMPDMLNSVDRSRIDVATQDRLKKAQDAESLKKSQQANDAARAAEERQDEVKLSGVAQKAMSSAPDVDEEKVARIKQAIEEGRYPVDSRRLAESFAALERMV